MRFIRISARQAYELAILSQRMNDALLKVDIAYVLAAGDERGMSEGWPKHVAGCFYKACPDCRN